MDTMEATNRADAANGLIDAGRYMLASALAWGTSGNASVRAEEGRMLITASGTDLGRLGDGDFAELDIASGEHVSGRKASKETPMHLGIYRERPDAGAVLHASPLYATMFACSGEGIESALFIESMYYLERVAYVDYAHPGSQALADMIAAQAPYANVIMMRNHGVVVFDDTVAEALMRLETLELTCRMIVEAKAAGIALRGVPQRTARDFLEASAYKPQKKLPETPVVLRDTSGVIRENSGELGETLGKLAEGGAGAGGERGAGE